MVNAERELLRKGIKMDDANRRDFPPELSDEEIKAELKKQKRANKKK